MNIINKIDKFFNIFLLIFVIVINYKVGNMIGKHYTFNTIPIQILFLIKILSFVLTFFSIKLLILIGYFIVGIGLYFVKIFTKNVKYYEKYDNLMIERMKKFYKFW